MIMMPAWSRMREDKKIECLACNMLIDNCSCVWAAIRDLQKVKDDIHLRMDNILQLHRNKFSGIQSDICKLIDELREHQKLPHSMPLYGRYWIKDKTPEKATHAADAASYMAEVKENPSRKVLEQKLKDKNSRIQQLEQINSANKKIIEELECLRDVHKDRLQRDLSRMEERCRGCSYCKPMSGCCL